jgi:molybdopterin synthase catalytic subunit
MRRELIIDPAPINERALGDARRVSPGDGAVICFLGYVRESEGNLKIEALEYEAFDRMARHQFQLLFDQIEKKWPIHSVRVVHRTGVVRVNEASLWVEVIAPHRGEAFAACQWLIDEMKRVVPIWKKPIENSQAPNSKSQ